MSYIVTMSIYIILVMREKGRPFKRYNSYYRYQ